MVCAAASANAATIIDVPATAVGKTVFLDAGTYNFNFIGTAQGGAYDSWLAWSAIAGCNSAGMNCAQGWTLRMAVDFGNALGAFDRTNGLYFRQTLTSGNNHMYATPEQANGEANNAPYFTSPLVGNLPYDAYPGSTGPFTFTLDTSKNVNFFVRDSVYTDNSGGVSFSLSAVPEPATWAMMLVGFGALGFAMRRPARRQAADCQAA